MTGETGSARRAPRVPFALLVIVLVAGGLALLLALNTASAANELRRHALADKDESVAAHVEQLRNDVAASAAPAALARNAAGLGMVPANAPAFVVVDRDGSADVMGKPRAATEAPLPAPSSAQHKHKPGSSPSRSDRVTSPPSSPGATSAGSASGSSKSSTSPNSSKSPKSANSSTSASSPATATHSTPRHTPTPTLTLPGGTR